VWVAKKKTMEKKASRAQDKRGFNLPTWFKGLGVWKEPGVGKKIKKEGRGAGFERGNSQRNERSVKKKFSN